MKNILVTGGAGFIGINTAFHYLAANDKVTIFDNCSREGSKYNLLKLHERYPHVEFILGDIRNKQNVEEVVKGKDIIFHFAGQVAVTTSVKNPVEDFEINALGTLNILEAIREHNPNAILVYASTNKVYGGMEDEELIEKPNRYSFKNLPNGVSEKYPLDFHSPYGCSKGTADQYIRDYARIYGLNTIVFRQSCIYGQYQFGIEDQGWVAWFVIAALQNKNITIYGNGKQVRDVLYINDLIEAYEKAINNIEITKGQIYNIGGGTFNYSIWKDFHPILEEQLQQKITFTTADARPGDQLIYISNTSKAEKDFNWKPTTNLNEGIVNVINWVKKNVT